MRSAPVSEGGALYGTAGTVRTSNLRYRYLPLGRKRSSAICTHPGLRPGRMCRGKTGLHNKAYRTSFTFEASRTWWI